MLRQIDIASARNILLSNPHWLDKAPLVSASPATLKSYIPQDVYSPQLITILGYYQLLLTHRGFANCIICSYYSMEEDWLVNYQQHLDWWSVSINEAIDWRNIYIQRVEHRLSHCAVREEHLCDNYCVECSENPTFPWSIFLIEQWKQQVNWCFLAQNKSFVTRHGFLIEHYESQFQPYLDIIAETRANPSVDIFERQVQYQRTRFTTDLKIIVESELTGRALIANSELLWKDIYQHLLDNPTVDYLLSRIFQ